MTELEGEEVDASAILLFFWGQNREICPFWSQWKHFPSLIRLLFSSSVMVALALVLLRSIAFGSWQQVRVFVHCSLVPPITLLLLSRLLSWIYSSCCVRAESVQVAQLYGWSNLTQFQTRLFGSPFWNKSNVTLWSRLYPALLARFWNREMKSSRLSLTICRVFNSCWAFALSAVSVYACLNLVSMVCHRFSSVCSTPPCTWSTNHWACSYTQSSTNGPLM